jgi:hypothetical protein
MILIIGLVVLVTVIWCYRAIMREFENHTTDLDIHHSHDDKKEDI